MKEIKRSTKTPPMAPPMMGPRILFLLEDACVEVALALALDEVELILLVLELEPVDDVEGDEDED